MGTFKVTRGGTISDTCASVKETRCLVRNPVTLTGNEIAESIQLNKERNEAKRYRKSIRENA